MRQLEALAYRAPPLLADRDRGRGFAEEESRPLLQPASNIILRNIETIYEILLTSKALRAHISVSLRLSRCTE